MRPIIITQGALGATAWVYVNNLAIDFKIGLGAAITSGASLTYSVQHTFDETGNPRRVAITRITTVATVVDADHRLSVGDNVLITGSGSTNLDGSYDVASIVDANTYTYTVANTGALAAGDNVMLSSFRVYPHATIAAQTGRVDGNYAFPVAYIRLKVTTYVSGKVDLTIIQGMGR